MKKSLPEELTLSITNSLTLFLTNILILSLNNTLCILQRRILVWVAISSSRGSSQPRDGTRISCGSCMGRQILYYCATWEALYFIPNSRNPPASLQNKGDPWPHFPDGAAETRRGGETCRRSHRRILSSSVGFGSQSSWHASPPLPHHLLLGAWAELPGGHRSHCPAAFSPS